MLIFSGLVYAQTTQYQIFLSPLVFIMVFSFVLASIVTKNGISVGKVFGFLIFSIAVVYALEYLNLPWLPISTIQTNGLNALLHPIPIAFLGIVFVGLYYLFVLLKLQKGGAKVIDKIDLRHNADIGDD